MEIKDLILLMWRNLRTIVLGLILGLALGFFAARFQNPVYEATAKVFVSRTRPQGSADTLSLSDEQLLAINLQLAKSPPVLDEVSRQLGGRVDADAIRVEAIPNTLILQIKVQDADPQRAAAAANLLVQVLVQENIEMLSARYTAFENAIAAQVTGVEKQMEDLQAQITRASEAGTQAQLTQVNQQIEQLRAEISALEREIAAYPPVPSPFERAARAEKQAQLDQQNALLTLYQQIQTNLTYIGKPGPGEVGLDDPTLATLQSTLNLYQQIHLTLINNRENVSLARIQNQQNVMPIVSATTPKNPARPMPMLYTLLGGFVGLALSATAVLILEHFDDSIRKPRQAEDLLCLPVLGSIFDDRSKKNLVTLQYPHSLEADAFRSLGASLEILIAGRNVRSVMVMNAESADSKTDIAANWAVICAQQGKRVILVDGDRKRPHLHNLFGLENKKGLDELVNERLDLKSACIAVRNVEGISILPAGAAGKESAAWLGADKAARVLSALEAESDLVIVKGPAPETADAQILASKMGAVILVIRQGHTRRDTAQAVLQRLNIIGANVIGIIMDRGPRRSRLGARLDYWFKGKFDKKGTTGEAEKKMAASSVPLR